MEVLDNSLFRASADSPARGKDGRRRVQQQHPQLLTVGPVGVEVAATLRVGVREPTESVGRSCSDSGSSQASSPLGTPAKPRIQALSSQVHRDPACARVVRHQRVSLTTLCLSEVFTGGAVSCRVVRHTTMLHTSDD